jgi:hypothetical protein
MRFSRDRRGYEHTYVLHAARGQSRQEPRILYWFRTPPHVRVGRAAIDEEAIRLLEETHPDVSFEWSRMLKAQPPPAPPADEFPRRRGKQRRPDEKKPQRPPPATPTQPVRVDEASAEIEAGAGIDTGVEAAVEAEGLVDLTQLEPDELQEQLQAAEPAEALEASDTREVPAGILEPADAPEASRSREPAGLLDPEVLERLRTRYAELLARISQRIPDPVQRDVLRGEAERLNPEMWVTPEEARNGLEHFEQWFEGIRSQLPAAAGHRRRRRRRGRGGSGPAPSSGPGEV